jgi:hypothetical protein
MQNLGNGGRESSLQRGIRPELVLILIGRNSCRMVRGAFYLLYNSSSDELGPEAMPVTKAYKPFNTKGIITRNPTSAIRPAHTMVAV